MKKMPELDKLQHDNNFKVTVGQLLHDCFTKNIWERSKACTSKVVQAEINPVLT